MQAIQNFFTSTAPDREPSAQQPQQPPGGTLLSDWNSYASGTAAQPSAAPTDKLLASAEEGVSTVKNFMAGAMSLVSGSMAGAVNSATTTVQSAPGTTQWTYFIAFFGSGVLFLALSFFIFLPVIILAPAKFAMTFSIGSALVIASLGALKGWQQMFGHLFSKERLPFTAAYGGSLVATLYAALMMHSYLFSLVFCGLQLVTLVYYVASYFPGGAQGAQSVLGFAGRTTATIGGAALRATLSAVSR